LGRLCIPFGRRLSGMMDVLAGLLSRKLTKNESPVVEPSLSSKVASDSGGDKVNDGPEGLPRAGADMSSTFPTEEAEDLKAIDGDGDGSECTASGKTDVGDMVNGPFPLIDFESIWSAIVSCFPI